MYFTTDITSEFSIVGTVRDVESIFCHLLQPGQLWAQNKSFCLFFLSAFVKSRVKEFAKVFLSRLEKFPFRSTKCKLQSYLLGKFVASINRKEKKLENLVAICCRLLSTENREAYRVILCWILEVTIWRKSSRSEVCKERKRKLESRSEGLIDEWIRSVRRVKRVKKPLVVKRNVFEVIEVALKSWNVIASNDC